MKKNVLILSLFSLLQFSCTTTTEHITKTAEERGIIRNNKKEPEWAVSYSKEASNDKTYFVYRVEKSKKLPIAIEKAKTYALGNISQRIGTDIAKIATAAISGDDTIADDVTEAIEVGVSTLSETSISGAQQEDLYWEEVKDKKGKGSHYNVVILVSIPDDEFERAKKLFMKKFSSSKGTEKVKDKVEKAVNDYNEETKN